MTQFKSYLSKIVSPPMLRGSRVLFTRIQLAIFTLEAGPADQDNLKWRDA